MKDNYEVAQQNNKQERTGVDLTRSGQSIESQLFNWNAWDMLGVARFVFYRCKLKQAIGQFKVDEIAPQIIVDYETSTLTIQKETGAPLCIKRIALQIID